MHGYSVGVFWEGNRGSGTSEYAGYGRRFRVVVEGKPELEGSADLAYRGDPGLHNPEELLVAAIASCHMLFYLSLCARSGISVVAYSDSAQGTLELDPGGGGQFSEVTLRPRVTVARGTDVERALALHATASDRCFIARSCSFPIHHLPEVRAGDAAREETEHA